MLVFTRRLSEEIAIGEDITIQVVQIKGKQVRIGINAPKEVKAHRREVFQRIKSENKSEQKKKEQ